MKNKKGFTLIELIIVVVMMCIIALIIAPIIIDNKRSDCRICQTYEKKLEIINKQYQKHIKEKH